MTDRELLELAAKAAGLDVFWWPADDPVALRMKRNNNLWNPLTDDGDALRLAVKLKIDVAHTNIHSPQIHALADAKVQEFEDSSSDPYAATRRAIVKAAAEIGRNTAPPQRKPLTEEEIRRIYETHRASVPLYHAIARAVERAHGIGGGNE